MDARLLKVALEQVAYPYRLGTISTRNMSPWARARCASLRIAGQPLLMLQRSQQSIVEALVSVELVNIVCRMAFKSVSTTSSGLYRTCKYGVALCNSIPPRLMHVCSAASLHSVLLCTLRQNSAESYTWQIWQQTLTINLGPHYLKRRAVW